MMQLLFLLQIHILAIDFENEYLDWNSIVGIFPASQELFQTFTQTSALFLLLMVYKDFYSVDNEYATVTSVLKTMNCRWNKAKNNGDVLDIACQCG